MSAIPMIAAPFDDIRPRDVRLIEEAAKLEGPPVVALWTDEAIHQASGSSPKFPFVERGYVIESLKFVRDVAPSSQPRLILPEIAESVLSRFPDPPLCP